MRSLILLFFLSVVIIGVSSAQQSVSQSSSQSRSDSERNSVKMDPTKQLELKLGLLKEFLPLNEEQTAQVKVILEETYTSDELELPEDAPEGGGVVSLKSIMDKKNARIEEQQARIKALLNDDQQKKYEMYLEAQQKQEQRKVPTKGNELVK